MKFILARQPGSSKFTWGTILNGDVPICTTLELPWLDNQRGISCIPEGTYNCIPLIDHLTDSGHLFGRCIRVLDVPNRDGILIHPGNHISDTHGCILVGSAISLGFVELIESRLALVRLFQVCKDSEFDLEIISLP